MSAEAVVAGLAEADRLAARGCYLCLKEAAAAYASLLDRSNDPVVAMKALETNLMIVLRELELRIPDSGARDAAQALSSRAPASYAAYFAVIGAVGPANHLRQGSGGQEARPYVPPWHEERKKLATELENEWRASAMKAYFYIAAALSAGLAETLKPQLHGIVSAHHDLSLKYQLQAFRPTFSIDASRALIGQETGFGEVHLLLGSRSMLAGRMDDAHRDLTRARELLPDSASVAAALASVKMSYARYGEALALYERVLATWPDETARLGRAKALSYLGRHEDAIALLDEMLLKDARNTPGEKYYWRAWNHLRLDQLQAAYEDTRSALNVMRNDAVYRLAGIAALRVGNLREARTNFEGALQMNGDDCDSLAYLGQLDALERNPKPAFARYSSAVACYDGQLSRMAIELAGYEQDISGLSNGLIAALRAQIGETKALRAASMTHADTISKGAGFQVP